jgi:hypothetical protein
VGLKREPSVFHPVCIFPAEVVLLFVERLVIISKLLTRHALVGPLVA